jgi:hypothetical protein
VCSRCFFKIAECVLALLYKKPGENIHYFLDIINYFVNTETAAISGTRNRFSQLAGNWTTKNYCVRMHKIRRIWSIRVVFD